MIRNANKASTEGRMLLHKELVNQSGDFKTKLFLNKHGFDSIEGLVFMNLQPWTT